MVLKNPSLQTRIDFESKQKELYDKAKQIAEQFGVKVGIIFVNNEGESQKFSTSPTLPFDGLVLSSTNAPQIPVVPTAPPVEPVVPPQPYTQPYPQPQPYVQPQLYSHPQPFTQPQPYVQPQPQLYSPPYSSPQICSKSEKKQMMPVQSTKVTAFSKKQVQPLKNDKKGRYETIAMTNEKDGKQIAQELMKFDHFKIIDVEERKLKLQIKGDEGAKIFREIFEYNTVVTSLSILGNRDDPQKKNILGKEGWSHISYCLNNLTELTFSGHKINMDEAVMIYVGLRSNTTLTKLDIWNNGIESDVAYFLVSNLITTLPTLRYINLGENHLDANVRLNIKRLTKGYNNLKVDMF